eukprot:gene2954-1936_t
MLLTILVVLLMRLFDLLYMLYLHERLLNRLITSSSMEIPELILLVVFTCDSWVTYEGCLHCTLYDWLDCIIVYAGTCFCCVADLCFRVVLLLRLASVGYNYFTCLSTWVQMGYYLWVYVMDLLLCLRVLSTAVEYVCYSFNFRMRDCYSVANYILKWMCTCYGCLLITVNACIMSDYRV